MTSNGPASSVSYAPAPPAGATSRICGSGEMANLVRSFDWSSSPLGPIHSWSDSLICSVNIVLGARLPMQLLWGREMIIIYNDAMMGFMTGKHPHALGQPGSQVWREAWPQVGAQLDSVLRDGSPVNFHNIFLPLERNGVLEDMFWDYSYSPVYDAHGAIAGILNVSQNTTEANVGRQQLQASEARAQRILLSIGDAVIVTDADGNITRMNPVAEDLTGWTGNDAQGLPLSDIFHIVNESTRIRSESPAEKVQRLGTVVGLANHTILIRRDGTEIHIDDSGAPIRDEAGNLTGIVLVFRDIGQRRIAEKDRDYALQQLQLITDAVPAYIAYIDTHLRYVRLNRTYEEWSGQPAGQMIGRTIEEVLGADAALTVRPHLEAALAGEPQTFEYTININNRKRILRSTQIPHIDADGIVHGVIVHAHDITDQKLSEEALIQSEKLAAVGRLAASIAHEINNPLESVTNLLYLARLGNNAPDVQEYLETADRELRRAAAITNQTLRFHKQSTRPVLVTCQEIVSSVVSIFQGRIVNSHIQLERRKRAERPILCFDGEIRQVLNNLVGNAIDAMHPKGGRLIVRSRHAVDHRTGREGVAITVADTGSGMPSEALKRAFEPFFTTKGIGGTGLGLWISQEIMKRHHGSLTVKSSQRPGHRGTVFVIFLPFDAAVR